MSARKVFIARKTFVARKVFSAGKAFMEEVENSMEKVENESAFFESLMKGIVALFGSKCEVVLHDLTGSYESTVVMIENGHVTGRKIGD